MAIYKGSADSGTLQKGSTGISEVYKGSTKVLSSVENYDIDFTKDGSVAEGSVDVWTTSNKLPYTGTTSFVLTKERPAGYYTGSFPTGSNRTIIAVGSSQVTISTTTETFTIAVSEAFSTIAVRNYDTGATMGPMSKWTYSATDPSDKSTTGQTTYHK